MDHGNYLAGQVSQEFWVSKELLDKGLVKFLGQTVEHYIKNSAARKQIKDFWLISVWIVRQFRNEYNPVHWHGGHISGVGYLKLPETFGNAIQKNKSVRQHGKINFVHGSKMLLCNSKISFMPEVGDFYIFPNYLMHSVNPFYADGERRSFSFNAYIDEEIYDVYKKSD